MRIMNAFCGIGGNRSLWGNKHKITAIDNNQQIALIYHKRFPDDTIIIGDAFEYCLRNYDKFDFLWVSIPCDTHSGANNFLHAQGCRRFPDGRLWEVIVYLKYFCQYNKKDIKFVVENVKPFYFKFLDNRHFLIEPDFILGRHYFWSNLTIPEKKFKNPSILNAKPNTKKSNIEQLEILCEFHNIEKKLINLLKNKNWKNNDLKGSVLRNCVNAEIGKYILDTLIHSKNDQKTIKNYI